MKMTYVATCFAASAVFANPADAQVFAHYACDNGTQFAAAFYEGSVAIQLDGKALLLPQRLALPGNARYAKSGITITVKGGNLTLRRSGGSTACMSATVLPFYKATVIENEENDKNER